MWAAYSPRPRHTPLTPKDRGLLFTCEKDNICDSRQILIARFSQVAQMLWSTDGPHGRHGMRASLCRNTL